MSSGHSRRATAPFPDQLVDEEDISSPGLLSTTSSTRSRHAERHARRETAEFPDQMLGDDDGLLGENDSELGAVLEEDETQHEEDEAGVQPPFQRQESLEFPDEDPNVVHEHADLLHRLSSSNILDGLDGGAEDDDDDDVDEPEDIDYGGGSDVDSENVDEPVDLDVGGGSDDDSMLSSGVTLGGPNRLVQNRPAVLKVQEDATDNLGAGMLSPGFGTSMDSIHSPLVSLDGDDDDFALVPSPNAPHRALAPKVSSRTQVASPSSRAHRPSKAASPSTVQSSTSVAASLRQRLAALRQRRGSAGATSLSKSPSSSKSITLLSAGSPGAEFPNSPLLSNPGSDTASPDIVHRNLQVAEDKNGLSASPLHDPQRLATDGGSRRDPMDITPSSGSGGFDITPAASPVGDAVSDVGSERSASSRATTGVSATSPAGAGMLARSLSSLSDEQGWLVDKMLLSTSTDDLFLMDDDDAGLLSEPPRRRQSASSPSTRTTGFDISPLTPSREMKRSAPPSEPSEEVTAQLARSESVRQRLMALRSKVRSRLTASMNLGSPAQQDQKDGGGEEEEEEEAEVEEQEQEQVEEQERDEAQVDEEEQEEQEHPDEVEDEEQEVAPQEPEPQEPEEPEPQEPEEPENDEQTKPTRKPHRSAMNKPTASKLRRKGGSPADASQKRRLRPKKGASPQSEDTPPKPRRSSLMKPGRRGPAKPGTSPGTGKSPPARGMRKPGSSSTSNTNSPGTGKSPPARMRKPGTSPGTGKSPPSRGMRKPGSSSTSTTNSPATGKSPPARGMRKLGSSSTPAKKRPPGGGLRRPSIKAPSSSSPPDKKPAPGGGLRRSSIKAPSSSSPPDKKPAPSAARRGRGSGLRRPSSSRGGKPTRGRPTRRGGLRRPSKVKLDE